MTPLLLLAGVTPLGCADADVVAAETAGTTTDPGSTGPDTETDIPTDTEDTGTGTDTTDTGEPMCGDGVVDPGEECDDGNQDDIDGCTAACTLGACAFEWIRGESSVALDYNLGMDIEDGTIIAAAASVEVDPWSAPVLRFDPDGALESTVSPVLQPENQRPEGFALDTSGDYLFASSDDGDPPLLHVHRVSADGQSVWQIDRGEDLLYGLARNPADADGPLVLATTVEVSGMDKDARIVALDPSDGSELWTRDYSGVTAANGYSLDFGWVAVVDDQGRAYFGVHEYVDWDTTAPVVVAYESDGTERWVADVLELPGHDIEPRAVELADGMLLATAQEWDGYFRSWIVALDAQTGEQLWTFSYDDLPIERVWTAAMDVASDGQRVVATGYWSYFDEANGDQHVVQAYALGLNLDGTLACYATYDEYDPDQPDGRQSWVPRAIKHDGAGNFFVAGTVHPYFDEPLPFELLIGRVR